jgi:hypothetical protein
MMRDFLRQMQVLRKDEGLEIEDRIYIVYKTDSPKSRAMLENYKDFICSELLCLEIREDVSLVSAHSFNLSGEEIVVSITPRRRTL